MIYNLNNINPYRAGHYASAATGTKGFAISLREELQLMQETVAEAFPFMAARVMTSRH